MASWLNCAGQEIKRITIISWYVKVEETATMPSDL